MAGNASVLQTNTREQLDYIYAKNSSYIDNLRSQKDTAIRKIITLQKEISNLKMAAKKVQQEMNRNTKLNDIQQFYSYDRYQTNDHIQAIKPIQNYGPDPDPRMNYARNHLLKGNEQYEAEKNRIENEILRRNREINHQRQNLKDIQDKLTVIGATASTSITKDGISKRQYTEVYMLYQIHSQYAAYTNRVFSYDKPSAGQISNLLIRVEGVELYTSDPAYLKLTTKLKDMFTLYAERSPFVLNGDLILDFVDPGSLVNEKVLFNFMDKLRTVMNNAEFTKFDTETKNYTSQVLSNVQEPFISKYVLRQQESARVPDPENSFREKTSTPPNNINNFINGVGATTTIAWDSTSLIQAALSNFNTTMSGLYGMPFCSPSTVISDSDAQKMAAYKAQVQVDATSATIFSDQLLRAQEKDKVSVDKAVETAENLLADVAWATTHLTDLQKTPSTGFAFPEIIVGGTTYVGDSLYHLRIVRAAQALVDRLGELKSSGSIDQAFYDSYLGNLKTVLDSADWS